MEQEPKSPDVNSAIAYYFEQTKELNQAEKYYLKAISLAGGRGAQFNNYGAFLCRQGHYKEAEYYFLKAVNDLKYVHTAAVYENAGLCSLSASNEEKAALYFTQALNQDPLRKDSFYELLKLENKNGHHKQAVTLAQKYAHLVLGDKILLSLAKESAEKIGQDSIAKEYELYINRLGSNVDNSGVNDEYNNYTG